MQNSGSKPRESGTRMLVEAEDHKPNTTFSLAYASLRMKQ